MPQPRAAVILAAGQGTRMRSSTPKVLHEVAGRAMLAWSVALARSCGADKIVVVVGKDARAVSDAATQLGCEVAVQDPPLGTGHAVLAAKSALAGFDGHAVVLFADTPLIRPDTVERAFAALDDGAGVAVLGFEPADPGSYGRLVRGSDGVVERIVEAKDANEAELAIGLCNSGVLGASATVLFELLAEVKNDNAKGEYYLTDVVGLAHGRGLRTRAVLAPADEVLGVNSRTDLAAAEASYQARTRAEVLERGVTLRAPETVFFSHDTVIEPDAVIEPHVVFGLGATIEGGAVVHAFSHIAGAVVRKGASVGPYTRLRPGADVGEGAKVGNFVELKKTRLGKGAKVSHLTYLGDAEVGDGANIGAGTITCNYDGYSKHKTIIGPGAFIGSDTALVAPVTVGAGAVIGAGSVITKDVPADALAVVRGKQRHIDGWAITFRRKNGDEA